MNPQWENLEAALVCLRDPLSRIQLAASQLGDGATAGESPVRSIQQAIGEIDLRIEDVLTGLRRAHHDDAPQADIRDALSRAICDLGPVLATRGMSLSLLPLPDAPVPGDESLVRRTLCRLLLGASRWTHTHASRVQIGLVAEGSRCGIRLEVAVCDAGPADCTRDMLGPVRGFALGEGIALEQREQPETGSSLVIAWFGRELAA